MDIEAVAQRAHRVVQAVPEGTVVTVLVDSSVVIDRPAEAQLEHAWPYDRLVSFLVSEPPPSPREIREGIEQALR